jgi:hypothetical protein
VVGDEEGYGESGKSDDKETKRAMATVAKVVATATKRAMATVREGNVDNGKSNG